MVTVRTQTVLFFVTLRRSSCERSRWEKPPPSQSEDVRREITVDRLSLEGDFRGRLFLVAIDRPRTLSTASDAFLDSSYKDNDDDVNG